MATLGVTENTQTIPQLVADNNYGPVRIKETLTAGNFVAGTVLGRITASGKMTDYDNIAVDGSELATAVLLEDADASVVDVTALVGYAGVYRSEKMTGLDADGQSDLEARGIYFV